VQVLTRPLNRAGGDQVWEQIRCLDKEDPAVSDWSRNWVIYACRGPSSSDIWAMPTDGSSSPKPYLHTRARETLGRLSRDEQWIVYQSDDSGANEIYAQLFQGGGQPRSVSGPGGGANPEWSDDGLQIIYRKSNRLGAVMAVAVTRTSSVLEFGKPRELPWSQPGRGFTIAIARDLSHALMTKPVDGTARDTPLIVRDNWLQLLGTTK